MSLQELVDISHFYGANADYVIAGGGNTSFKDGGTLYMKGSGTSLGDITGDGFVRMDRKALKTIWDNSYPADADERESAVLADMMAARMPGETKKRPSVETLLHDILPFAYVVHTHPTLVNGLTCSEQGENAMREMFGHEALWIPSLNPGYILSKTIKSALEDRLKLGRKTPIIFLQNHGIFIGADDAAGIKAHYSSILNKIEGRIKRKPDMTAIAVPDGANETAEKLIRAASKLVRGEYSWSAKMGLTPEIKTLVQSRAAFTPVSSSFTPDHIVYAGSEPLFIESEDEIHIKDALGAFYERNKRLPKIIAVQNRGVFGLGDGEKAASLALALFQDAVKVSVYAESFCGQKFMSAEQIDFINNWEVERYRSKVSVGK